MGTIESIGTIGAVDTIDSINYSLLSVCAFVGLGTKPSIATRQLMIGLMMLKKQNGRYTSVGMPSTVLCVMPHAVQGTSTEVTVAESSVERLSSSGR